MATDVDRRWWAELGLVVGLGALVRLLFVFVVLDSCLLVV